MDDLQNQTQELLNNLLMGKLVKHDEVKGLLREVVEECLTIDGAALFILAVQHIKKKREHLAWLLEEDK